MPIYEYQCPCGKTKELRLSYEEGEQPQTCSCGKTMERQMSVSSFKMKLTGAGMALDSLNAPGGGFSARSRHTPWKEQKVFEGI